MPSGADPDLSSGEPSRRDVERVKLVHNEKTKLRATFLNTIAAGFTVAGVITPIVGLLRGEGAVGGGVLIVSIVWFLVAVSLHYTSQLTLEDLK